ncbi:LmeA family phospholipid-binding protein [Cellulomonas composti]|uniref:DUF2993 domain-containing protein n=1 Tax=Cellulomonas composti TaxID=266130 RepID=A0A511J832_9CELL|nr:DUF2993 domain-containing protein [Cellulomonas composti]GEL94161.1 hypothetical protein CCO02nite_08190 [Cellulomonas composti]
MSAKGWIIAVSVVAVVGAGAVAADRVIARTTEERVSQAVVDNLEDVTGTPTVEMGGFPFLTQVLRGSIDTMTVTVDGATLGGLRATDVVFEGTSVSTTQPYTVGEAQVVAVLPTSSLQTVVAERTGLDLTLTVDGSTMRVAGSLLGIDLSAAIEPGVEDGALVVDVVDIELGGVTITIDDLPDAIGSVLSGLRVPIDELPEGMTLASVSVMPDGLAVTATGTDVVLEQP